MPFSIVYRYPNILITTLRSSHCLLRSSSWTFDIFSYVGASYGTSSFQSAPDLKKRAGGHSPRAFVNSKRLVVQGGNGGDGCIAFERLFANAKGGPNGGDGGNGGHVILQASQDVSDLSHIPSIVRAENGIRGHGDNCHGASAKHVYLKVPIGTQVCLLPDPGSGTSHGDGMDPQIVSKQMKLLDEDAAIFIAAHGGSGGKGNAFLTNSAQITGAAPDDGRNAPLRIAERGARGECRRILLRMTQLAQLGLVGAPNAGKSTLLRGLTRARPKVAPYPFTTLKPHLGVISNPESCHIPENEEEEDIEDPPMHALKGDRITVADLPGLIEGAAEHNTGLGAEFLSLIADCPLLAYVIDVGTLWLDGAYLIASEVDRVPWIAGQIASQLTMLHHELNTFDPQLTDSRRCMIIGTKLDLIFPSDTLHSPVTDTSLWRTLHHLIVQAACECDILTASDSDRVILVSARRGDNLSELLRSIRHHTSGIPMNKNND